MALAWRRGAVGWVAVAGAALALWGCGFVQSDNAWDAVVDPWLVGWALVMGVGGACRGVVSGRGVRWIRSPQSQSKEAHP